MSVALSVFFPHSLLTLLLLDMLSVWTLLFCVSACISLVRARYSYDFGEATKDASNVEALYVTLPVDHFSDNPATFLNRYWVNDEFYRDGGPVIRK
jgi:hypothetical protein